MTQDPMNICWLDLETTGSDEHTGSIVEVGAIITDQDLREIEAISLLVQPDPEHVDAMPEVVRRMHEASGLLDAMDANEQARIDGEEAGDNPLVDADRLLARFLDRHAVDGRVILAGSGVSHFDHRWIRLHLPRSAKRLTYWSYDVGNVRRFLGSIDKDLLRPTPEGGKAHRGIADAQDHLDEWRFYRQMIREAVTPLRIAALRGQGSHVPAPVQFGDRVEDGGMMGTIVRCEECGGSGQMHAPDAIPEPTTPDSDPVE